jgi:hypothetical protein
MAAGTRYSFELNEEMLKNMAGANPVEALLDEFVAAVEKGTPETNQIEILKNYGRRLALSALKLGEEYSDRTYEIMKKQEGPIYSVYFPSAFWRSPI